MFLRCVVIVDVGYAVDGTAISLPFRMNPSTKFAWNLTTSPIGCDGLGAQCTQAVWTPGGTFEYSRSASKFPVKTECDFVVRRWSRRICRLELEFQQFQVGIAGAANCSSNFLDVGGQELCGELTGRKRNIHIRL